MTEYSNPYATAAADFAAVDIAPYPVRLQEIVDDEAHLERAIATAEARVRELSQAIAQAKLAGPNGDAAADAILAGDDVMAASPTATALEEERATTNAGLAQLRIRRNTSSSRKDVVRDEVRKWLGASAQPAADELAQRADAAVRELARLFADARALSAATENLAAKNLAGRLGRVLGGAPECGFLGNRPVLSVSGDVLAMLEPARPAIEFAHGRIVPEVSFPMG